MALPDFNNYKENNTLIVNDTVDNLYKNYIAWLINTKKLQEATVAELLWQIKLISEYVENNVLNVTKETLAQPLNRAILDMETRNRNNDIAVKALVTFFVILPLVAFAILMGSSFAPAAAHIMVAARDGGMVSLTGTLRGWAYVALAVSVISNLLVREHRNEWKLSEQSSSISMLDTASNSTNRMINAQVREANKVLAVNRTLLLSWNNGFKTLNMESAMADTVIVDLNQLNNALRLSV